MPRPRKARRVTAVPLVTFYKPQGIPMESLKGMVLTIDGLEALRLADADGVEHSKAASSMGVSRPTFSRLLTEARHIVATALVNGLALRINGGDFWLEEDDTAPPAT